MRKFLALLLLLSWLPLQAQTVAVSGVRLWTAPDHTRLVFDASAAIDHKVFSLEDPQRLVIDLQAVKLQASPPAPKAEDPLIRRIRSAERNGGQDLRVVLDLKQSVRPKSFLLKPNREYGHRLVVDLYPSVQAAGKAAQAVTKSIDQARSRDVVIAIDAGHGGEDPGARGPKGTYEKNAVLAIARKLEALVEREPGMRPVMIRDGDYYVGLRQRMEKAHQARADLFISIHADAFRDRRVRGSSVYTLSERGASSEAARWLADSENAADLVGGVGGVRLEDKDQLLASVLLDLSQTAAMEASNEVAQEVHGELSKLGKTHKRQVQQAGFVVLKSPDIPSLLVETAFISNPREERKLNDPAHQRRLAAALMQGIRDFFHRSPPPGTWLADNRKPPSEHEYVISRGDTLSTIAQRHQVSLSILKQFNGLSSDRIRIGQKLRIPLPEG